jgi:NAD(P)-dependent dehydrogenase (short-subunit alcohol dehydrogenase family)
MRKVLLIGGSGGVGRGIHPYLEKKYDVYSVNSKQFPLPEMNFTFGWKDIDIVVNLASLTVDCELNNQDIKNKSIINVNCLGAVNVLSAFLPHMRERGYGRIIMMSSIYAEINVKTQGVYSASKAFVDKLVRVAALENAAYGVTVNSIQLGYTGIGMGDSSEENKERARNKVAMKRFCTMEELYNTIEYIINTEYLTGQNIRLDGYNR